MSWTDVSNNVAENWEMCASGLSILGIVATDYIRRERRNCSQELERASDRLKNKYSIAEIGRELLEFENGKPEIERINKLIDSY